jgi:geranylgeranyl diphosphate synthase type II
MRVRDSGVRAVTFAAYQAACGPLIERALDGAVPSGDALPAPLHDAMRHSLFGGSKRVRPLLVLAAAEAVGGTVVQALPVACAVEMIHTYSLIHDDLPSMDDDSLRRGRPTSHVVFGEAIAILAGDALQSHAFAVLAEPLPLCKVPAERRLRAVAELAKASGAPGMVGGQVFDLESEGKPVDAGTLERIHRHKTGALIRAAVRVGAIVSGANDDDLERLTRFGEEAGLAFQIVDDILDVEGSEQTLGKSAGKDARAGKATYPRVHGIGEARLRAEELLSSALDRLEPFGARGLSLAALAERMIRRSS